MTTHKIFSYRLLLLACMATLVFSQSSLAAFDWLQTGKQLLGGSTTDNNSTQLSNKEIGLGLKDALRIGSERVVNQVGSNDGFNADPQIHIPLPENLQSARTALTAIGMGYMFDDLEVKLNRAAEASAPEARELFWDAIEQMTLHDVQSIYKGPDDAATRYFQTKMSAPLSEKMQPIIDRQLAEVGAIKSYDAAIDKYKSLPFVPHVKADLTSYVIEKGMDGIFFYLAKEETAIRQNPAKRTTDLLRKVFAK